MRARLFFLAGSILVVALIHLPHIGMPLFWDELGQFVPTALDLYREGRWVPRSAEPNVHPPGLPAYLAAVWHVFGYSIPATRAAMLLVGGACVFLTFLLAIRLCREFRGAPAFTAAALLVISPVFYTQSMLAQLDLPAALFTLWALLWFLGGRYRAAALVCIALVLTKETGISTPAVLGFWLWRDGKRREAAWFILPALALAGWIGVLYLSTGHLFGSGEFTRYNVFYPLHPVRLPLALLRRVFFLFFDQFHWIGWIGVIAAWRMFGEREWKLAATVAIAQVALVTVLGGATLERYLLPVLPVMYIAMAAAGRRVAHAALAAGLLLSLFWRGPLPAPLENNLAMLDFVRLHQAAARYLEATDRTIVTGWPLSDALRRPEAGYVEHPLRVREAERPGAIGPDELLVLYSREPPFPFLEHWRERFYGYEPELTPEQAEQRLGLRRIAAWSRGRQWLAVFRRE